MNLTEIPITECNVNHIFKLDAERLIKINTMGSHPLLWCNGLLFYLGEFQNIESVITSQIQGRYFLDTIIYAVSPLLDIAKWNGYSTEVLDMTGHKFYEELTKELMKIV